MTDEHLPGQQDLLRDMQKEADAPAPAQGSTHTLMAAAEEYVQLKEQIGADEEALKELKARYKELRGTVIPELMAELKMVDAKGHGSFTLSTGEKLFLKNDLHASFSKMNEDAVFEWLRSRGDEALIKLVVHAGTLKAYVKEMLEKGEEPPEELITTYPFQTTNMRRK